MHPYFVSALAEDHRAYLRATAARRTPGRAARQPGWLARWLRRRPHPPEEMKPTAARHVRLAPVLVMAPPFPPSGGRSVPASAPRDETRPVELAS
jgi:hypothetical protein